MAKPEASEDADIISRELAEIDAGVAEIPEIDSATPSGAAVSTTPQEEHVEPEPTKTEDASITPTPSTAATVEQPQPTDDEVDEETAKILAMEPKTRTQKEGFGPLKDHIKKLSRELITVKKDLTEKDKEIQSAKEGAPPPEKVEEWKKLEERAQHVDAEHMIRSRFVPQRERIINEANAALKEFGIKDSVIKVINDRGGLVAFSMSKRKAGAQWKNADGSEMTEADWFDAHVFSKLSRPQQAQITEYQKDFQKLTSQERREIEEGTRNAREFLDRQRTEFRERFNKEVNDTLKELIESLPADVPKGVREIPKDATPEQRKEIEEWNKIWEKGDQFFTTKVTSILSARDRTELTFKAAVYDAVMTLRDAANKRADAEKERADKAVEQLEAIKRSRNMGRMNNAPAKPPREPATPDHAMSDEQAVDTYL